MTRLPLYQVDAFTDRPFAGNPAAVCPLESWLPDDVMQAIARENNLSETAFFVPEGEGFGLRWFTPTLEVDLCGHATLATAHVVFTRLRPDLDVARFTTRSGELSVQRRNGDLVMDFPATRANASPPLPEVAELLGPTAPVDFFTVPKLHGADYYLFVYADRAHVAALAPKFALLAANVIATAPAGEEDGGADFVSRFFGPASGVNEDPVTGSAHCTLAPYWVERLGRNPLRARQISARGGELTVEVRGDRVLLAGRCADYLEGTISI